MNPAAPTQFRVLIVDDEPTARRGVRLLLEQVPDVTVMGEAAHVEEAIRLIESGKPDILLLDVQMPELDGFELIRRVGPRDMPVVVFITAYDEYALKAFEVNAVDYLLKPFEDERFHNALARAKDVVRQRQAEVLNARLNRLLTFLEAKPPATESQSGEESGYMDRILIKSSGEIIFLKAEEVDWIEAEGDYMVFHVGNKTHMLRETMARLESRLDPKRFVRIHRSTIVNIERVRKLTPSFVGEYAVVLADGTKLKLSRGYHDKLQSVLKQSL
jgi:two-component system, LytTR family, response regulator